MKKTIDLTMFIIPNSVCTIDRAPATLGFMVTKNAKRLKQFGIEYQENEPGFQVWVYCPEDKAQNDNWTDHGVSDAYTHLFTTETHTNAFNRIPLSAIAGKKEGDVITFTNELGTIVNIKLDQLSHRYCASGKFEEVVATVLASYPKQKAWEDAQEYITHTV